MARRKKKDDETLATEDIKKGRKDVELSSRLSKQNKKQKTTNNEDTKSLSESKTKSCSVKKKIVNIEVQNEKNSVSRTSKRIRQAKKVTNDADSDPEPPTAKRPRQVAAKKLKPDKNEPKLKKARIVLKKLDIKQEVDHSENENSSGISADSGCLSDLTSKGDESVSNKKSIKVEKPSCSNISRSGIGHDDDSTTSESEWEEVEENEEQTLENYNPVIPKEGVEITIDCPDLKFKRRKKKEFDEMEWIRLYVNRMRKEAQLNVHKCHMLCLLARGLHINETINSSFLRGMAFSLIPTGILDWTKGKKVDKIDADGIVRIVKWFRSSVIYNSQENTFSDIFTNLSKAFEIAVSLNASEYNLMFIIIARVLGFKARFCMSLYPMSYKAANLIKKSKKKDEEASKQLDSNKETGLSESEIKSRSDVKPKIENISEQKVKSDEKSIKKMSDHANPSKMETKCKSENKSTSKVKPKKKDVNKEKPKEKKTCMKKEQKSSSNNEPKRSRPRRSLGKNYKLSSDESADEAEDVDFNVKEEEDFKKPKVYRKSCTKTPKQQTNRKILSDSDSDSLSPPLYACYHPDKVMYWAEVFSKPDKEWIPVECVHNIVNDPYEVEAVLPQPVSYVVGIDNDSYVKDVTKRYCKKYMTFNIKQRVVSDWWDETLAPFAPPNSKLDKEEEKNLETTLINQPLPCTVGGFKNHPLYALKRHLLKFEAIYPPDAAPVGFIRKEPIYLRENIVQLHSRETWLKEARVVRIGEEPYKIVKARPKWDRIAGVLRTDLPLDIFGFWQTEPYEPPIAVDGKVPRNEYGNVELFKPCMLPRGTVHIQLPGINRIAKKLGIDCSAAVVGFDGHKGSVHPVFEGFVVCEEFKDTILAAWDEEQENIRKREEEKREKRIYGNWKKLIRGLLIRERLKVKYAEK